MTHRKSGVISKVSKRTVPEAWTKALTTGAAAPPRAYSPLAAGGAQRPLGCHTALASHTVVTNGSGGCRMRRDETGIPTHR